MIGICIAAVLVVEALPASLTEWDISQEQTTSISQETADYVAGLENDVTIYLIAEEGEEDERIVRLLQQYADASDRVSVVQKDRCSTGVHQPVHVGRGDGQQPDRHVRATSIASWTTTTYTRVKLVVVTATRSAANRR